jgi:hypothetical protein
MMRKEINASREEVEVVALCERADLSGVDEDTLTACRRARKEAMKRGGEERRQRVRITTKGLR